MVILSVWLSFSLTLSGRTLFVSVIALPRLDAVNELIFADSNENFDKLIPQVFAVAGHEETDLLKYIQVARRCTHFILARRLLQNLIIINMAIAAIRLVYFLLLFLLLDHDILPTEALGNA